MMKKLVIFLLAILVLGCTYGQNVQAKWGAPFKAGILRYNFRVLSSNSEGVSIIAPTPGLPGERSMSVYSFDAGLNYRSVKTYKLVDGERVLNYEFTVKLKGQTLVFSSFTDLKGATKSLYYNVFDRVTRELTAKSVKVIDMPIVTKPFPSVGEFNFTISPDSTTLALIYNPPSGKEDQQRFACVVLDESLNIVANRTDAFPFKDRNYNLESIAVSDDGVVFLNGTLKIGSNDPFSKAPNYQYAVLMMKPDGDTPKEINISLEKMFITDLRIGCDRDGDLFAAGFYSETGTYSLKGTLSVKIDGETGDIIHAYYKEFPLELLTAGLNDKQAERVESKVAKGKNIELRRFVMKDLVLRPDGGAYLLAEKNYSVTTTTTNANGQTSSHTTYYAENIIVVGLNTDGEIDLTQTILKKQKSASPDIISYVPMVKGSTLYFMFTDNALNNAPHPPEVQYASYRKGGITTVAEVNSQGVVTRKPLYKFENFYYYLFPYLAETLPGGDVILIGRRGSKAVMGLVTAGE